MSTRRRASTGAVNSMNKRRDAVVESTWQDRVREGNSVNCRKPVDVRGELFSCGNAAFPHHCYSERV